ncbi:hypothetical protein Tco_0281123 [Tanacetum coccineum]
MTSFDYRLNPIYAIKECSSCGALYTSEYCCFKEGLVDKIICDLPDSSQRPPPSCARCGTPVDGPYCQGCALLRKKFKEDLFTYCVENEFFKDLQDTSESSDDNTNVVNAPQEPFVGNQDPEGEEKRIAESKKSLRSILDDSHCLRDDANTNTTAFTPFLPIEEPDNSHSRGVTSILTLFQHTESDDIETIIPTGGDRDSVDDITHDVEIIDSLRDNHTPSSEVMIKSTSTFPNLFLEETNTFDNSSPEAETFCFDLEEISSGSTHLLILDFLIPDYEALLLWMSHIKEKNLVAVHLSHADFLNMIRSSLSFRSIQFPHAIGMIFI